MEEGRFPQRTRKLVRLQGKICKTESIGYCLLSEFAPFPICDDWGKKATVLENVATVSQVAKGRKQDTASAVSGAKTRCETHVPGDRAPINISVHDLWHELVANHLN